MMFPLTVLNRYDSPRSIRGISKDILISLFICLVLGLILEYTSVKYTTKYCKKGPKG